MSQAGHPKQLFRLDRAAQLPLASIDQFLLQHQRQDWQEWRAKKVRLLKVHGEESLVCILRYADRTARTAERAILQDDVFPVCTPGNGNCEYAIVSGFRETHVDVADTFAEPAGYGHQCRYIRWKEP